jgi:hypothetical protein
MSDIEIPSWIMRTDQGTQYGPFNEEQIILFASEGRIVASTVLSHPVATKGQFVNAMRFPKIAKRINEYQKLESSPSPPPIANAKPLTVQLDALKQLLPESKATKRAIRARSLLVNIAHAFSLAWILVAIAIVPFVGISNTSGILHGMSTGAIPGVGRAQSSDTFRYIFLFVLIVIRYCMPAIALSLLAEMLHAIVVIQRSQTAAK